MLDVTSDESCQKAAAIVNASVGADGAVHAVVTTAGFLKLDILERTRA